MFFEKHKVFWHLLGKGDSNLTDLDYTLDNIMKKCTSTGLRHKKSMSVVTMYRLWRQNVGQGVLGENYLWQLSDTMLFLWGSI